jgi:hypothetical protein
MGPLRSGPSPPAAHSSSWAEGRLSDKLHHSISRVHLVRPNCGPYYEQLTIAESSRRGPGPSLFAASLHLRHDGRQTGLHAPPLRAESGPLRLRALQSRSLQSRKAVGALACGIVRLFSCARWLCRRSGRIFALFFQLAARPLIWPARKMMVC